VHESEKDLALTVGRISGVNARKCMRCGKCSGACPAFDQMDIHPHRFVAMVEHGDITALMRSGSLYQCMSCFACVERCPRGVKPAALIEAVRVMVLRQKDARHLTPDQIPALLNEALPQQAITSALRKYQK
jgi:heterodisulfide reductase subunit C